MRALICAAIACAALSAQAQERPKVLPDRDVTVTYRGEAQVERVSYSASERVFRRTHDGEPGYVLMNTRDGTMRLVSEKHRATVLMQGELAAGPFPWSPAMRFHRIGQDTVAGLPCTDWQMSVEAQGGVPGSEQGRVCLTADGVLLRFSFGEGGDVASEVVYGPQDPAGFRVTAGYHTLSQREAMLLR